MKLITVRRVTKRYYGVGVLNKRKRKHRWTLLRWHNQVPLQLVYRSADKARRCAAHIRKQLREKV